MGAHSPTNIPNLSPWAGSGDLLRNQIAILAAMLMNPAM